MKNTRTEGPSIDIKDRSFTAEALIILMTALVTIELFSLLGWSIGIASILESPIGIVSGLVLVGFGLSSVWGLVKKSRLGIYAAFLVSSSTIVLCVFSLFHLYEESTLSIANLLSLSTSLVISLLSIPFAFQTRTAPQMISVSEASENQLGHGEYVIETRDVRKNYILGQNTVSAVNGLNLRIKKGEFVAIMGPSGSGKSTLLNLLGALDKPSSGQILIDGIDISDLNENNLAKLRNEKIGFVFQAYNLIARSSVAHNMELPALVKGYSKEEREEKMTALLGTVGLSNKKQRKPKTLSGGEQQRVAIARALINDPEIVLADEPTGNVDSKTGQSIMGFFRKLNSEKKTTIIIVTHDPEVAKKTDRIIYFRDGAVLKEETTAVGISA